MFLGFNVLGHILEYWRYKCQILVGSTSLVKVQLQHSIYPDQLQFNFVRLIYFLCSILNQYHVDIKIVFDLMHHFYMDSFNKETFILSSNKTTKHIFARSIGIHNKNTVIYSGTRIAPITFRGHIFKVFTYPNWVKVCQNES